MAAPRRAMKRNCGPWPTPCAARVKEDVARLEDAGVIGEQAEHRTHQEHLQVMPDRYPASRRRTTDLARRARCARCASTRLVAPRVSAPTR